MNSDDSIIVGHNSSCVDSNVSLVVGNANQLANGRQAILIGTALALDKHETNQIVMGGWNSPTDSFFTLAKGTAHARKNIFEITDAGDILSTQMARLLARIAELEAKVQASSTPCSCST